MTWVIGSRRDFTDCDDFCVLEFTQIVGDIVAIDDFQQLKNFRHHHATTRYQHCLNVAWYTYLWSKAAGLNYISAARGAMLHDFFLYDRKTGQPIPGRHSEVHPIVALSNAEKYVSVDPIMQDCILHHMWPVSEIHPDTPEGMIVQAADKYCACIEAGSRPVNAIRPGLVRMIHLIAR